MSTWRRWARVVALSVLGCTPYTGNASLDASTDECIGGCRDAADGMPCEAGLARCGRACVSIATDVGHCGACGFACTGGARCEDGRCVGQPSCPKPDELGCGIVEIAGGALSLGLEGAVSAQPSTPVVTVSPCAMDVAEVTVARFRRYWQGTRPALPGRYINYYPPLRRTPVLGNVETPILRSQLASCNWSELPGNREDHPINCVTWNTAQAFCVWDGGRLPTEAEFELASRTTQGLRFPWGEAPPAGQLCWSGLSLRRSSCAVASYPATRGLYDLSGNMWELLGDDAEEYGRGCWATGFDTRDPLCVRGSVRRTARGGAWNDNNTNTLSGASRIYVQTVEVFDTIGFRCARSRYDPSNPMAPDPTLVPGDR